MTSTNYTSEWIAAVERSERLGLTVPTHQLEPNQRYLSPQRMVEFPYVAQQGLGELDFHDVVAQCLSIHHRLVPVMEDWFGCPVLYTLGWIDDGTEKGMFKFDEAFVADKLRFGHESTIVNIHAWLTLPSMEVIDVALATSLAVMHDAPDGHGGVIAQQPDELRGFKYRPMLVGDDFLRRTGLLVDLSVL